MKFSFLAKNIIGLDIADRSIEVLEIGSDKKRIKVINKGRLELDPGIVERGVIKDSEKLQEIIYSLFKKAKINNFSRKILIFGLPESQTFIHIFNLEEKDLKEEGEDLVRREIIRAIPLEEEDIIYDFVSEQEKTGETLLLSAAADRKIVKDWQNFLNKFSFAKIVIGFETFADYLGLGLKTEDKDLSVIDIGSETTMISVYSGKNSSTRFVSSIQKAGDYFNAKLAEKLKLDSNKIEDLKCRDGLKSKNKQFAKTLKATIDELVVELQETFQYCSKKYEIKVSKIILIGGSSQLPGLIPYLKKKIKLEVFLGNSPYLSGNKELLYIGAVGLALYDKKKFPVLDLTDFKKKKGSLIEKINKLKIKSEPEEEIKKELFNNDNHRGKKKKQIFSLLIIIVIGFLVLGSSFWYSKIHDKATKAKLASKIQNFSYIINIPLTIPIAINPQDQKSGIIVGRIFNDKVQSTSNKEEVINISRSTVLKSLGADEALRSKVLSVMSTLTQEARFSDKAVYTYQLKWLVYNNFQANDLFSKKAVEKLKEKDTNVKYALSNIKKGAIKVSPNNENIYLLSGLVSLATNKKIELVSNTLDSGLLGTSTKKIATLSSSSKSSMKSLSSSSKNLLTSTSSKKINLASSSLINSISSSSLLLTKISSSSVPSQLTVSTTSIVIIKKTGTGWLNVREQPNTESEIITKVYPGETYQSIDKNNSWIKIKLNSRESGWVFASYAQKL